MVSVLVLLTSDYNTQNGKRFCHIEDSLKQTVTNPEPLLKVDMMERETIRGELTRPDLHVW